MNWVRGKASHKNGGKTRVMLRKKVLTLINGSNLIKIFIAQWSLVVQKGNLSLNNIFKENSIKYISLFRCKLKAEINSQYKSFFLHQKYIT